MFVGMHCCRSYEASNGFACQPARRFPTSRGQATAATEFRSRLHDVAAIDFERFRDPTDSSSDGKLLVFGPIERSR